jgi:Ca-activated chloride channel family protein
MFFRFANPYYFFLLIPAAIAAWFVFRRRISRGILFSPVSRLPVRTATWRTRIAGVFPALFVLGLVLGIVSLSRPQTVFSLSHRKTDAVAMEMVVDTSGSMKALDLSVKTATGMQYRTRLDVIKEVFADFVSRRPDDLIGLVSFGGYASTRAPLTADHEALLHVLKGVEIIDPTTDRNGQAIDPEEALTAIGDALATACARLRDVEVKSRIVVLLTDGVSNAGIIKPEEAMKAAEKLGIKVYTIGVGSTGRAPFLATDMLGRRRIIDSWVELDEPLLRKIARTTGGRYFNVKNRKGIEEAMEEIDKLEKTEIERNIYNQYNELFPWFLGPALGLIVLGTGLNMLVTRRIV